MTVENENRTRPLTFIIHFAFLLCGIVTVLIGQILPVLSRRLGLNDAEAGGLFIAQFSGSLCGTVLFGLAARRFGFIKITLFGFAFITVGCLLLNSESWTIAALGLFVNGIGIGTSLPSINMLVVVLNPERQAAALSVLNFFWGVGAIFSQPFVAFFGTPESIFLPTAMLSALFFASAFALFFFRVKTGETSAERKGEEISDKPIWTHPLAWLIAAFNFIHVGFESGAGGWLTTYSARFPEGADSLLSATPAFFLLFVVGRGVAPLFLRVLSENRFLLLSLFILLAGTVLISLAGTFTTLVVGAAVAGFGTSAIFPANMARFTGIFGEAATRKAMPLFLSGTLGGAFVTQLIGLLSERFASLRSGIFVLLGCGLVLIFLQIVIASSSKAIQIHAK